MNVLVTGGGGFLGRAIVERLVARGDRVRSFARGDYPGLRALGVDVRRGDLTDARAVCDACRDCDLVFHVAALPGIGVRFEPYYRTNVVGTQNVIDACRAAGVGRLVYTSSPSVVFDGRDMAGADESVPYPAAHHAHYPATKAEAERRVLAANDPGGERGPPLATVALRPHLIWGPGDNHLVPRIIARARRLRRIGGTNPLVDTTFVDNAADAHLLAADRLLASSSSLDSHAAESLFPSGARSLNPSAPQPVAGRAFFISNGEPRPLWDVVNGILAAAGLPPVTRSVPRWAARVAGLCCETAYRLLLLRGEPPMTRFLAEELSTAHWFDISAARRDLGYAPRVSLDEGFSRLAAYFGGKAPR